MTEGPSNSANMRVRNNGWLVFYAIALIYLFFHGLALTAASIGIYFQPLGAHAPPLSFATLLIYVLTNSIEAAYIVILLFLMVNKRRALILNNAIYNVLAIVFVVLWYFLGAKSPIGTLIELAIAAWGICYVSMSNRVRTAFVN